LIGDIGLIALGMLVIAVIIGANGYFVAQEFAYMSVDRPTLRARAQSGDARAARALKVTDRTSFMLSGAQLGITVTGLLVGFVAEPLVGESLGKILNTGGVPAAVAVTVGTVIALVVAAVIQMIFGELFPKNLAIANPTPLSTALARSTLIYLAVFGWLISFFDKSSNALLRLIRVEPVHDLDVSASAEDLEYIVDTSRESGDLPEGLFVLLDRILDFPEQDVEHAMVPRSKTDLLSPGTTIAEVRKMMATSHTRYPVVDASDNPVGVVHLADVLGMSRTDTSPVTKIMRDPVVLPTSMTLPDALEQLIESKNQMACVIDEYGGFVGIITTEDLGEELIGDIRDEHDGAGNDEVLELAEGRWSVPGALPIDELERLLDFDLPEGDWETLSGLIISQHGGLPDQGEIVEIELEGTAEDLTSGDLVKRFLIAEIATLQRRVPARVNIEIREVSEDEDDDDSSASTEGDS
jgi:CBS domain containing-hemolysin-like protein